ncbi:MAG: hypothetical protein JJT90_13675 [Ectothiorhodospiraceae bacterium]|nr:hypothetical protein [Ectothiorhodospiraceae bacterium]
MKKLFLILIVLLLSVLAALWFHDQTGYVLVHVNGLSVQASLFLAVGVLLAGALALYFLLRLLWVLWHGPRDVRGWWHQRRQRLARSRLLRGMRRLAEGDFRGAEQDLARAAPNSETPLLHYLGSAMAAHREGAGQRRDRYLALADQASPEARLAVGLVQAQLYVEEGQYEAGFATLNVLQERWPRQARVLELLALCCERLGEWSRLLEIMPVVHRHAGLPRERVQQLERAAACGALNQAAAALDREQLRRIWARLPRVLCQDRAVLAVYVDGLLLCEPSSEEAERLLRKALSDDWDTRWLERLGRLVPRNPAALLSTVEGWLKRHPENPELLLVAGKLSLRAELWGQAQSFLEAAEQRGAPPESSYLLAALLERLGKEQAACVHYRRGLERAAGLEPVAELEQVHRGAAANA